MRFAVIAGSAAAVMTLLTQPAQAVASKVSGKYAFQEIDLCEAKLVTTTLDVLTPPAPTPGHQPVIKTISSAVHLKCAAEDVGLHKVEDRVRAWIPRKGAL